MSGSLKNRLEERELLLPKNVPGIVEKPSQNLVKADKEFKEILEFMQNKVLKDYPLIVADAREDVDKKNRLKNIILQALVKENLVEKKYEKNEIAQHLLNEIIGFGPIEPLIQDKNVTEIMVNGPSQIYIERSGLLELTKIEFEDEKHLFAIIERIVTPTGRRIDQSSPFVDARLPDGSRVHAIIPPLSLTGPILTVRKFMRKDMKMMNLVELGSLTSDMSNLLQKCVQAKLNILISGGTGSGKTTLLNALSGCIKNNEERIITIEDSAELQLNQDHVISLECRPPNIEGKGEITIRHLLRNALRMRPDRIIIGECRGAEAFDMLQAMNTGHSGSLTTIHANNVKDALSRLENMVLIAGETLPYNVIREQIKSAIDLIVQQVRFSDGTRKITSIATVNKTASEAPYLDTKYVFQFEAKGIDHQGRIFGEYKENLDNFFSKEIVEKLNIAGFSKEE